MKIIIIAWSISISSPNSIIIHLLSSRNIVSGKLSWATQLVPALYESFIYNINLTRFNTIAIQATAQMAADNEAVGLSRVHMGESKCILPLRDCFSFVLKHINTTRMQTISWEFIPLIYGRLGERILSNFLLYIPSDSAWLSSPGPGLGTASWRWTWRRGGRSAGCACERASVGPRWGNLKQNDGSSATGILKIFLKFDPIVIISKFIRWLNQN